MRIQKIFSIFPKTNERRKGGETERDMKSKRDRDKETETKREGQSERDKNKFVYTTGSFVNLALMKVRSP